MSKITTMCSSEMPLTLRSTFALELVRTLTKEGVNYVLVGDVRRFPFEISSDVDMVIESESIQKYFFTLHEFCQLRNARIIQVLQHEQSAWYSVCVWTDSEKLLHFLHPDVCSDYLRDGLLFLKDKDLLEGRVRISLSESSLCTFYVPAPSKSFIYYLLKKIDKEDLRKTEGEFLSTEWSKDPVGARSQLRKFWNDEIVESLSLAAAEDNWDAVREDIPTIKRSLRRKMAFSFHHTYAEFTRKITRILRPTGLHVAFLGIDGSGKSTILSNVRREIAPAFRKTHQFHFRPFFGRVPTSQTDFSLPHSKSMRGVFGSIVKLLWYFLDNTVGYFFFVFSDLIKSTFVLFDRCYYDLLVDPRRYRYGGPKWLPQILEKFIPSPDLIFVFDAPPQILITRKQEISLIEIKKLREGYLRLADNLTNAHVIDAARTKEEVQSEVKELILSFLANRTRERLEL